VEELIKLDSIEKTYSYASGEIKALKKIDLKINYGEFLAIVGRSGSGKSTLMNILGCLDTPTKGKYFLCKELVSKMSESKLSEIRNKTIGFIFQNFNLIPNLNALENVELPLIYRGICKNKRRKISKDALEQVGLLSRIKHYPAQLSGGQQQRVAIARAIAGKPSLILADEPTGNLDSASSESVLEIFCNLRNEKSTIILITHDIKVAQKTDKIITISDGLIDNSEQITNNEFRRHDSKLKA
jgi:putative ABC transport system ATP-binding protein